MSVGIDLLTAAGGGVSKQDNPRNGSVELLFPLVSRTFAGWNSNWAPGANHSIFVRYQAPANGTIDAVQIPIQTTLSGNIAAAVYDLGLTTNASLTRLQQSSPAAAAVGWNLLTFTAVPVVEGQHFMIGVWGSTALTYGTRMLNVGGFGQLFPDLGLMGGINGQLWGADFGSGIDQATALPTAFTNAALTAVATSSIVLLAPRFNRT